MVDSRFRLQVLRMRYPIGGYHLHGYRMFLRKTLQGLEWKFHIVQLSEAALTRLEKQERYFMKIFCPWN